MTTCFAPGHLTPQRQCSLCGAWYCDANNHGHTPQNCVFTLRCRFAVLQYQTVEAHRALAEAESRLGKEVTP